MTISRYNAFAGMTILIILSSIWEACHMPKPMIGSDPITETKQEIPDTIGKVAKVIFDSATYHFGEMKQGDTLQRKIFFTNQGPGDLIIELVTACECTKLEWPRLPVRPGRRGRIDIIYNSRDKKGPQTVDVDIIANTAPIVSSAKFKLLVKEAN
jgi:Protein of unknown function (DUF1573)